MDRQRITDQFKKYYGLNESFREGQLEAIESAIRGERIIVVQKTGWGKSLVYFMATKILREQGRGITLIISPLLVLMDNQIDAAAKLKLRVKTVNYQNYDEWEMIYDEIATGSLDALIISPERLANEEFREQLSRISNIGMLVIDEAHCISDWGHDFRPDYRRIVSIVKSMPKGTPLIATTATANDRVVEDIKKQLGDDIIEYRGHLMRNSLNIQTIRMESLAERLAWLKENIQFCPNTGIIYCLTINDCELVAKWLKENDIDCEAFHSRIDADKKSVIVKKFLKNEIKVLSATVAFGMGFDKPDIGFVIHFQKPKDVVAYYQQIGRAGRAEGKKADIILLYGMKDDEINNYFIDSAFPAEDLMIDIVKTLTKHPGLSLAQLEHYVNAKKYKIDGCLKYLAVEGTVYTQKERGRVSVKYFRTLNAWSLDREKIERITTRRYQELQQMNDFARLSSCYMKYLAIALDDKNACDCGHCTNCLGRDFYPRNASNKGVLEAEIYIKKGFHIIEKRKKYPDGKNIPAEYMCDNGFVLSSYADAGWGRVVSEGKYKHEFFSDELVDASVEVLFEIIKEKKITWVTYIDSLRRPELVKNFAERLAIKLGLKYRKAIIKTDPNAPQQKKCENSSYQYDNVVRSFSIDRKEIIQGENVLLIDDMVDSKWTLTVCGIKLQEAGSGLVTPFALASTAGKDFL